MTDAVAARAAGVSLPAAGVDRRARDRQDAPVGSELAEVRALELDVVAVAHLPREARPASVTLVPRPGQAASLPVERPPLGRRDAVADVGVAQEL